MPPYSQIHEEYFWYILLGGVVLIGLVWLAVKSRELTFTSRRHKNQPGGDEIHEYGRGVREGHGPMPLFLVVMLILFVAWAVGYTLYSVKHFPH